MNETLVLTPERILEVTEDVLRRYGLAKATVVDVARALDVSHGSVYRHFPSKASLREAVAKRWLDRASAPLEKIAEDLGAGSGKTGALAARAVRCQAKEVVRRPRDVRHLPDAGTRGVQDREGAQGRSHRPDSLHLSDGVKQGIFEVADVKKSARAVFDASIRFHHPAHSDEWSDPALSARTDALLAVAQKGLEAPS